MVVFFFDIFIIGIFSVVIWVKMNSGRLFRLRLFLLFGFVMFKDILLLLFVVVVLGWLLVLLLSFVLILRIGMFIVLVRILWCVLLLVRVV